MQDGTDDAVVREGLTTTVRTTVSADQIDHLGHMNVAHYATHAHTASVELLRRLGFDELTPTGVGADTAVQLVATDPLTAHRAEQLEGAPLAVRSCVVDAGAEEIRLYHELVNTEREQLSATFVHRVALIDVAPWQRRRFPDAVVAAALDHRGPIPAHGHPRTLGVYDEVHPLDLAEARARGLALGEPFAVPEDRVGPHGRVPVAEVRGLTFGHRPEERRPESDPDDVTWMWATMESRHRVFRAPRAGDVVQAFSADVHMTDKVFQRRSWVFDVEVGDLVAATDVVGLAFDRATRRATTFPAELRAEIEARYHPDLR